MWKRSLGVLVTWQMRYYSLFHPTKVIWFFLSWCLTNMGSKVKKKLRFPYSKVKLMKLRIWRKNLEESSSNSSASCYEGSLSFYFFFAGFAVWQCFQISPCRIYGQVCIFLSAFKCLPYFSEIKTLSEWLMVSVTIRGITATYCTWNYPWRPSCWSHTVPLYFSLCFLLQGFQLKAELSFLCSGRRMEVNRDHRRKLS